MIACVALLLATLPTQSLGQPLQSNTPLTLTKHTTSPSSSPTCTFPPDSPPTCSLPFDASLLLPGTQMHCVAADVSSLMPWAVLICGPGQPCLNGVVTDGKALVGIHGGPGQSSNELQGLVPLSEHVPLILYDQGHSGRSYALPTPSSGGVDGDIEVTMLNYVVELRRVLQTFGVKSVHVLGHSFGASIAIDYAHQYPQQTLSLTLLSPTVDGAWWREDADFHRNYLTDDVQQPLPEVGDPDASTELLMRWVLGPEVSMVDVQALMCRASGDVYETVWGKNEDLPNGQVSRFHRQDRLVRLKQKYRMPVLLGCGLLDEAPPIRMLNLAKALNEEDEGDEGDKGDKGDNGDDALPPTNVVVLPHSAHIIADKDWPYYITTVGAFVQQQPILPIASTNKATVPLKDVTNTIRSMQQSLRELEDDPSVDRRSYPYLGRLLTLKQAPPHGLKQLGAKDMADLLIRLESPNEPIDWDVVQAVVDVWYIGVMLDPSRLNDATLRPPDALLEALCKQMKTYETSRSPIDRIMYYVVGFGLQRLNVPNAPVFAPYNWQTIAQGLRMKYNNPVVYIYLLTHVYIYNTDFGTIPMKDVSGNVRQEIQDAVDELIQMTPLVFQERGFGRVFSGMVRPGAKYDLDTVYDCVSEIFFTVTRVYGKEHPVANALAVRMYEWMSTRHSNNEADKESHGHLLAVTVGAYAVWEGSTVYIPSGGAVSGGGEQVVVR